MGLVGGAAVAFSAPVVPLLVLFLAAPDTYASPMVRQGVLPAPLLTVGRAGWLPFFSGFGLAFVIAMTGVPEAYARVIYPARRGIDLVAGTALLGYGLWLVESLNAFTGLIRPKGRSSRRFSRWGVTFLLGLSAGLLLYHHLDPTYDSVFFASQIIRQSSHGVLAATSFVMGVGGAFLALAVALAGVSRARRGMDAALRAIGTAAGMLTAILGGLFLTGRYERLAFRLFGG
ncbi:MAG: hypothetical protein L0214_07740 [candidate division NC10 bacterium]|nr:hypothetical protein [candidate division NC10 bacterium]